MDIHGKTIKKSIFQSYLKIILIYVVLTSIVFNLCLRVYVRNQTKTQLVSAAELIKKYVNSELLNQDISAADDKETLKSVLKIDRMLKQTQTFLDVNFAVVGKKNKLIYPANSSSEEYEFISKYVIPVMNRRKVSSENISKNKIVNFTVNREKYIVLVHPLKLENINRSGYLLLYSSLNKMSRLIFTVNIILLLILLITSVIALFISNKVSKKISDPIIELGKYAKNIGERQYDALLVKFEDDEIGQLAEIMHSMKDKLSAYDNTMKTFLQNASHELRTPLMSIQGYAEGIKYDVVDNKDSAIDIIIDESKRLTGLVEDLIYLSKIDSPQDNMNMEKLNAEDLIRSSMDRVNGIAVKDEKTINFYCNTKGLLLYGDEEKLTRAMINILGNCLRYASKKVDINIEKDNSNIIILVRDDGCGFDEKDINNIFDRFYKGKGGNYGLGLAITKSIIEKHKGTITAGNNANGGAFYKINLPAA